MYCTSIHNFRPCSTFCQTEKFLPVFYPKRNPKAKYLLTNTLDEVYMGGHVKKSMSSSGALPAKGT